jgi:flagellar basal body P-ring formation chaperone FlgA
LRPLARNWFILAVAVAACASVCLAGGIAPPCALLAEARVSGDSVRLSDLLPVGASDALRRAAQQIRLADAPSPGGRLALPADQIAAALPEAARKAVLIPPAVLVLRAPRTLTSEEVLEALRSSRLPADAGFSPARLQAEDLHFSAPVRVAAEDARLQVRQADFDPALGLARFVLASAADPRALPFLVTARLPAPGPQASALLASAKPALAGAPLGRTPAWVEPGQLARLHVASASLQMFLEVLPLERGGLHDTVRVRLPSSGRVLRGEVVAPGRLEARF